MQAALAGGLRRGEGQREFKKAVDAEFERAGLTRLKPYQIENVYVTNTSLAYGAGQMGKMLEVSGDFPYWKYSATMDSKTRPGHAVLHGKIFRVGDFTFFPPIGFRCRCAAIPITARQAAQYLKSDMPSEAEKDSLYNTLESKEFAGNKQQKYLDWAAEQYKTADAGTRSLMDEAFDRMKAEIKAVAPTENPKKASRKSAPKAEDKTVIPAELRADSEYLKGSEIRFNPDFFKLIDKENPIRLVLKKGNGGSYYSPAERVVYIASSKRATDSKWFKERVIYHEFGHGIDRQRGLRTSTEVSTMMQKWKKELMKKQEYTFRKGGRIATLNLPRIEYVSYQLDEIRARVNKMDDATLAKRGITKDDVTEQIGSVQDTIMALNPTYGWGHTKAYYKRADMRHAEFISHAFENAFVGNEVFKKYLPELYDDMVGFINTLK